MSNVGYASLQVIPSAKGFAANLNREISGPLAKAGHDAGDKAGGGFVKNFAKTIAAGTAVVAAGVTAFAVKSSAKFAEVGSEVIKLSRFTGLAAEDASRLRFAGKEAGVGVDVLTKSLGILSKNLAGKGLDKLGFDFKDANGKIKPLNGSLLQIAKRFQTMPNGAEKTALAMKLFGRSGAELIPFLNRGADGIAELERQSDKFGATLSGKDLEAVKASTAAHRAFHAALEGLQIQVGRYVLPVFTKFVTFATTTLTPAIATAADLAKRYLGPAFDFAFGIIDRAMSRTIDFVQNVLVPGIRTGIAKIIEVVTPFAEKGWAAFERIRKAVDDRLTPALRDRLMPVLRRVVAFIGNNLAPALVGIGTAGAFAVASQFATLAGSLGGVVQAIAVLPNPVTLAVVAIAALAAGFVYAYKHSERFRQTVDRVTAGIKQAFDVLFHGKFTSGPFSANSPLIRDLFKFRDAIQREVLPRIREFADFVKANLKPILIGLGAVVLGLISPWLLVGTAIAVLYVKSQTFRDIIAAVADFLTTKVAPKVAAFASYIADQFSHLVGWVRTHWAAISEAIGHVIETIKVIVTVAVNIISALWRAWGDDLFHLAEKVFGHIRDTIANVLTVVRGVIDVVLSLINGDWGKAWDGIKEILSGVWAEIRNIIGLALDIVKALIGGVLSTIAQVWNGIWSGLSGVVSGAWKAVTGFVSDGVSTVLGFITGLPGQIAAIASTMWDSLSSGLSGVIDWIVGHITGLVNTIIDVINGAIGAYNAIPLAPNIPSIKHIGAPKASTAPTHDPHTNAPNTKGLGKIGHAPPLADGGVMKATYGGRYFRGAEAGVDEAAIPLSVRSLTPFAKAMAPMLTPARAQVAGSSHVWHLTVQATPDTDGVKVGRDVIATIKKAARVDPSFRKVLQDAVA